MLLDRILHHLRVCPPDVSHSRLLEVTMKLHILLFIVDSYLPEPRIS